jgi:hypothetical protein
MNFAPNMVLIHRLSLTPRRRRRVPLGFKIPPVCHCPSSSIPSPLIINIKHQPPPPKFVAILFAPPCCPHSMSHISQLLVVKSYDRLPHHLIDLSICGSRRLMVIRLEQFESIDAIALDHQSPKSASQNSHNHIQNTQNN